MPDVRDAPEGYSPLSGWDEFPIHQVVAPIRYVATSDPRAFERYWFTAQAADGSFYLITGIGFYPNIGVADAYALVVHEGRQTTIRAHRQLAADRADMRVGPFAFDPVRPFMEWRLAMADTGEGFSFDLRWFDTKRSRFSKADLSRLPHSPENIHLMHDWGGYEGFGNVEGEVRVGGKTVTLARNRFNGSRDHHWGIRDGVGGINLSRRKSGFAHTGQFVEFKDWGVWGWHILFPAQSSQRGPVFAEQVLQQIAFDPETRHFREAVVTNRLSNGETRRLHFKLLAGTTAYLRCAGYAGPDGRGSPDSGYLHGMGAGEPLVHVAHNVSDPAVRAELAGFEDHLCVVTCNGETTIGVYECMNPALYEMCAARVPGFEFLDEDQRP